MGSPDAEDVRDRPEPPLLIAQRVPEFGGAYLEDDSLVVLLTEPSESAVERVRNAWREVMGEEYASADVAVRPAVYSGLQLDRWFRSARDVHLTAPSLVFATIDWRSNRLTFGVAGPDEERTVLEQELLLLGIRLRLST